MGMARCGQHPSGNKVLGKNKIRFADEWSWVLLQPYLLSFTSNP